MKINKYFLCLLPVIGFILLVCLIHNGQNDVVSTNISGTDFIANPITQTTTEVTITSVITTTTTSTTTSTETTLTSSTTEVKTTTTETVPVQAESPSESIYELVSDECEETSYYITDSERIMLCNLVGREYGSDYVSVEEKAKVVAVVMNRVNSAEFPDTVYDVLTQPNQFSGYIPSDSYSYQVTDSVIQAVDYYFNHSSEYGSYLYFEGDGTWNYFH